MRTLFSISMLLAVPAIEITAQNIQGRIVDSESKPVAMATVILQAVDSTYIGGTTSGEDGTFALQCDKLPFRLTVSSLGYESVSYVYDHNNVGNIVLAENATMLKGVEVKTDRRVVDLKDGRLVANVKDILKSRVVTDAFDLAKYVPGILKNSDGSLNIAGSQSTTLLVGGKTLNMSGSDLISYLKTIPAERVERIEVIYDAPPELHVTGGVINVILKKVRHQEVSGQVKGWMENKHRNTFGGSGTLFYDTNKWSLYGMYSFEDGRSITSEKLYNRHNVDGKVYDVNIDNRETGHSLSHRVYANAGYKISDKSDVSISYSAKFTPKDDKDGVSANSYFGDKALAQRGESGWHDVSVDFSGKSLKASVDYMRYNMQNDRITTSGSGADAASSLSYFSKQVVDRVYAYTDWSKRIVKNVSALAGAAYYYSRSQNTVRNDGTVGGNDTNVDNRTVSTEHTANVYAGLTGYAFASKLYYRATFNMRYYHTDQYHRMTFFPQATLTWRISNAHILAANYLWTRNYPSYWDSQATTAYLDDYIVTKGNPSLKPMTMNYAVLTYLLRSKYSLQVTYARYDNYIGSDYYQNQKKLELVSQNTNMDLAELIQFTASAPVNIGKWYYGNYSLNEMLWNVKGDNMYNDGINYRSKRWTTMLSANHTFIVSRKPMISVDVLTFYRSRMNCYQHYYDSNWMVDAGVKWQFCKNRAILAFNASDIFESSMPLIHKRIGAQQYDWDLRSYTRNFSLTFTYKFRNFKEKQAKDVDLSRMGTR